MFRVYSSGLRWFTRVSTVNSSRYGVLTVADPPRHLIERPGHFWDFNAVDR